MRYRKGNSLAEGKTKIIWKVQGKPDLVIIESKNAITKFDDPSKTKKFATKAVCSTTTTCRVFELLKKAGIPVAYLEQISDTEFLAQRCTMIPLEVVARRFACGGFLKRHPEIMFTEGQAPSRFHRLLIEFFLKTTKGKLIVQGKTLVDGLDAKKKEEDPFIENPYSENWKLLNSKKPSWDLQVDLKRTIKASLILQNRSHETIGKMENILREVFLVLEGAWNILGFHLIDIKIEFGIARGSNRFLLADVLDSDSWRLQNEEWEELSKEAFRQNEALSKVEQNYGLVASLTKQFRVPKQALVLWRGSPKDKFLDIKAPFSKSRGVDIIEVTLSGHKKTRQCLDKLNEILRDYPDGGVIVAKIGRSNGLAPMLAAHSSWQVIAIPATMEKSPEDIWSSIRMPSLVPLVTAWPEKNALLAAMNILAAKNPLLYMWRQKQIEELDI